MNVLSLFDGISCGRVALERARIDVGRYYASEIDQRIQLQREAKGIRRPKVQALLGVRPHLEGNEAHVFSSRERVDEEGVERHHHRRGGR